MPDRLPPSAGGVYGRVLAHLDPSVLATWSEATGVKLLVSRWYARLFGYPELAAHHRFGVIREMLGRHAGRRVLDLGAGNGLYSIADGIARPGSTHILIDLSRRHLRRATTTGASIGLRLSGIAGTAEALPLPTASVDTVLMIEVLQFVDDDASAVREIARVLRPGGVWLCEQDRPPVGTPIPRTAERRLQKRRPGYAVETLRDLGRSVGLELEEFRVVTGRRGRRWEAWDGALFQRSRPLHFLLFPAIRLLAALSTPRPAPDEPGTVLYRFRKPAHAPGAS